MAHKTLHSLPPVAYVCYHQDSPRAHLPEDLIQLEETRAALQRYGFAVAEDIELFVDLQDAGAPSLRVLLDVPQEDPDAEHVCEISNGTLETRHHRVAFAQDNSPTAEEGSQTWHIPMTEVTGAQIPGQTEDALKANVIAEQSATFYAQNMTRDRRHRDTVLEQGDVSAKPALRTDYGTGGPRASRAPQLAAPAEIQWLREDLLDTDWPHEDCQITTENNPADFGSHVVNQWSLRFDTTTGNRITISETATGIADSTSPGIVTGYEAEHVTYDPEGDGVGEVVSRRRFGTSDYEFQELTSYLTSTLTELETSQPGVSPQQLEQQLRLQPEHQHTSPHGAGVN